MMRLSRNNQKGGQIEKRSALFFMLSFFLPAVIIMAALAGLRVTPFGDKSLVLSDGDVLYINYLGYVGRAIKGQESILFSFEKGLGGNMMSSWSWFLLNPFFILFAFADITHYMSTFTYVSVLNFCLCGLTMYVLLRDIYGHKLSNLIFSTAYALNGFLVANVFQMNFFIGVSTLPLMVLGLRKILKNQSPLVYILALTYSLMMNFYFGFMLCAASLLIFLTVFFVYRKELDNKKAITMKYILASLLSGIMSSVIWLPAIISLRGGRLDQPLTYALTFQESMPFIEMFSKLFTGANNTLELSNGLPNIFVGILPVALVILFFISKNIHQKMKTVGAILICIYLVSFYVVVFNIIMHGGTVTNWFNYRDSFVFSFFVLLIAAEEWQYITIEPNQNIKRVAIILIISILVVFSKRYDYVTGSEVLIDLVILATMYLALIMYKKDPEKNPKRIFEAVILLLMCVNLFLNYGFSTRKILIWTNSEAEYKKTVFPVSTLIDAVHKSDNNFYRMEVGEQRSGDCGNDPMLYGYYGVGHGGSDDRNFVRNALSKLGVRRFDMRNSYNKGIPAATDTLLGLKYIISKENLSEEKGYKALINFEELTLYQNLDVLPISMLVTDRVSEIETDYEDIFINLNRAWEAISGEDYMLFEEENDITFVSHNMTDPFSITQHEATEIVSSIDAANSDSTSKNQPELSESITSTSQDFIKDGILKEIPEDTSYIEYSWTAKKDGPVYSYNRSGLMDDRGAYIPVLNYEGWYNEGDTITSYLPVSNNLITQTLLKDVAGRFRAAYADNDALHELATIVKERPCTIEKVKDSHLRGTFTAEAGQKLMFTIPFDEGWTCWIDGKEAEIKQVLGVFMAVDAPEGAHSYEMKFFPKGMKTGIGLSTAALLTTLVFVPVDRRRRKTPQKTLEGLSVDAPENA